MQVISFEDQANYVSAASQPFCDIAKVMLGTGMRPEEVFRIRTENIDFKQPSIFNPFGKTKAARRTIPMTVDVLALLKARAQKAEKMGTPFIFSSPHMRYVHPAAAQKRVAIEEFDKFSTKGIIAAAAAVAQENQRVPTKVTTVERINECEQTVSY